MQKGGSVLELNHIAQREGRLSSFLLGELRMSLGLMNKLKWGDAIQVNGAPQHTNFQVCPGDVITVKLEEEQPEYPAENGELSVIYEDEYILAVDKPAGMLIHPSHSRFTGTLANLVAGYYQKCGQKSAFHPLTRLDRDTFGIVLIAKNSHINQLLQSGGAKKTYHAIVLGYPNTPEGIIDAPIGRRPLPSLLRYVCPEGKPSVTEYRVLAKSEKLCKLELRPITGRTHQLRVHCAHMGFPIVGDPQYGSTQCMEFGWQSQALCAKRLEFTHPMTGEHMVLESSMDVTLFAEDGKGVEP